MSPGLKKQNKRGEGGMVESTGYVLKPAHLHNPDEWKHTHTPVTFFIGAKGLPKHCFVPHGSLDLTASSHSGEWLGEPAPPDSSHLTQTPGTAHSLKHQHLYQHSWAQSSRHQEPGQFFFPVEFRLTVGDALLPPGHGAAPRRVFKSW